MSNSYFNIYKVLRFAIVKTGIPVASKMMPATRHKNPDMYMVTGYELAHRMGKPEYMSMSSLGKYLNCNSGKYRFWLEKSTRNWWSQSSPLKKGKKLHHMEDTHISLVFVKVRYLINFQTHRYKMTQTVIVFSISRLDMILIIRLDWIIIIDIEKKDLSVCKYI